MFLDTVQCYMYFNVNSQMEPFKKEEILEIVKNHDSNNLNMGSYLMCSWEKSWVFLHSGNKQIEMGFHN